MRVVTQAMDRPAALDDEPLVLRGAVDAVVGDLLGAMLAERIAAGASGVAIDLSAVESIDAAGLVAIVRAWHEMAAGGRALTLLDPSAAVGPLLTMSGLSTVTRPAD